MEIGFTRQRPNETWEEFRKRDQAASEAKRQWDAAQGIRKALGQIEIEPDWNAWEPTPSVGSLSPSLPITEPPLWMKGALPMPIDWHPHWGPVVPASPLPPGTGPGFDFGQQPKSIFDSNAPFQPVVVYPNQSIETLGLRPTDVLKGLAKGAEFVFENGRWIVRVGLKVLGPVGAIGAAKDLYDFTRWMDKQYASKPNPPRTRYDLMTNQILWEHPDGRWSVTPPVL